MSSQLRSENGSAKKDCQHNSGYPVSDPSQLLGYFSTQASHSLYYQPMQEAESYPRSFQSSEHHLSSDESSQGTQFPGHTSHERYNSTSTFSFSPNESPLPQQDSQSYTYHSPENTYESPRNGHPHISSDTEKCKKTMDIIPKGDLKYMLISCAKAVSESDKDPLMVELFMAELRQMVSVSGDPIQRLGAYMLEGLIARLASSGSSIYKALRCKEPASADLLSYMHILYEICPYFKFGYMSANGAIAEAIKGENQIHIIDFQIAQGSQWITLMQALAARPGGPPCIRITGIDDATSAYARGGGLEIVGKRLSRIAESFNMPFEFQAVGMSGYEIERENLKVRYGEALAVNFPYMLHHMPDESVTTQNHRDRLLRLVKSLSPKVVTLVEQESNTNTAPFFPRFLETLDYYTAIFQSIDVTLPREDRERINVEQHCLARDIVNIIACEGVERVERHELLGKWRSRFTMAGFVPYPLNSSVNATIKTLLGNYCENYRLEERDGALYLGWMNRALVTSCAWR